MEQITKTVGLELVNELLEQARQSPRRRQNFNLHPRLEDPVQRLFNVMHPGAYVRPHRHRGEGRWEVFLVLRGAVSVFVFDDTPAVAQRIELAARGPELAVEIPAGAWHSLVVQEPDTVLFELKPGPYFPLEDRDFAAWAPAEGEEGSDRLLTWLLTARARAEVPVG